MGTEGFRKIFRNHIYPCSGGKCLLPGQKQTFLYSESRRIVFRENDCSHTCRMLGARPLLSPACRVCGVGALEEGGTNRLLCWESGSLHGWEHHAVHICIYWLDRRVRTQIFFFIYLLDSVSYQTGPQCGIVLHWREKKNNMLVISPWSFTSDSLWKH